MKKIVFFALAVVIALGGLTRCGDDDSAYCIVTFDTQGGSTVSAQSVMYGYYALRPEVNPSRDGYTFSGWYHDSGAQRGWDFQRDLITSDVTIWAGWVSNSNSNSHAALAAAIAAVKALPEGAYTADSWAVLKTALAAAEAVNANPDATQQQVTDALTNLNNAASGLQLNTSTGGQTTVANKSALNASIANAESKVQSDYTTDSWNAMQNALADAKKVSSDPAASQAQADAAKASLDRAIAALQHVTVTDSSANKNALNSFIADSEKLNQSDYTADSWNVFQNALNDAKAVSADAAATQQQVDTAYTNLETAVNNLALAQTDTGVVSGLVNQLTSLVNALPSADVIKANPLLAAIATPTARLADQVRDQLIPLVGDSNAAVNGLSSQLNGILSALNLGSLI
jgi:uncharacterized repeat protein (TIGR02543 family)